MRLPRLATPLPIAAFDVENRVSEQASGLELLGYSLYPLGLRHEPRRALHPGEVAELVLYTKSAAPITAPLQVSLERHGAAIATLDLANVSAGLPAGHIARTVWQLAIPADAAAGRYRLTVRDAAGQAVPLGSVSIVR